MFVIESLSFRQTLRVLETLDPGLSRFKGFQLFKLYQILFEKVRKIWFNELLTLIQVTHHLRGY